MQHALVGQPGILSVAQIGNSLRVLGDGQGDPAGRVREALSRADMQADVAAIDPNLEDVFVAATHPVNDARKVA